MSHSLGTEQKLSNEITFSFFTEECSSLSPNLYRKIQHMAEQITALEIKDRVCKDFCATITKVYSRIERGIANKIEKIHLIKLL